MSRLGFDLKLEALTEDVLRSSEIEGEVLDRAAVRSSLARRLGVPDAAVVVADRWTEGVVAMMLDATENHAVPLTAARLFGWQAALFPTGYSGLHRVKTGQWRDDAGAPLQVVSGPIERERVHFRAPPALSLDAEMRWFLDWFNRRPGPDGLLRAGLRICGSSPCIPSTTVMAGWRGRSRIRRWRSPRGRVSASTACPARSGGSGRITMPC